MSIYKGGHILADISDSYITKTETDLLPQDLKEYLKRYINPDIFTKEVLSKPIELIVTDDNSDFKYRIRFDTLSDDYSYLIGIKVIENTVLTIYISSSELKINYSVKVLEEHS